MVAGQYVGDSEEIIYYRECGLVQEMTEDDTINLLSKHIYLAPYVALMALLLIWLFLYPVGFPDTRCGINGACGRIVFWPDHKCPKYRWVLHNGQRQTKFGSWCRNADGHYIKTIWHGHLSSGRYREDNEIMAKELQEQTESASGNRHKGREQQSE